MKKILIIILAFFIVENAKAQFEDTYLVSFDNTVLAANTQPYGDFAVAFYEVTGGANYKPVKTTNGRFITCLWGKTDYKQPNMTANTITLKSNFQGTIIARFFLRIRDHDGDSPDDDLNVVDSEFGVNRMRNDNLPGEKDDQCCHGCTGHTSIDLSDFNNRQTWISAADFEGNFSTSNDGDKVWFKLTLSKIPKPVKVSTSDDIVIAEAAVRAKNLTADCRFTGSNQIERLNSKVTNNPIWVKIYDQDARIFFNPRSAKALFTKGDIGKYSIVLNNSNRSIGWPTTDHLPTTRKLGGAIQDFEGGTLVWSANTNTHLVKGIVLKEWSKIGADGITGFPKTDEIYINKNTGVVQHFEQGSIYYKFGKPDAYYITGAVYKKYGELGYEKGVLGYPRTDFDVDKAKSGGTQWFEKGAMYYSLTTGAHYVPEGELYNRYGFNNFNDGKLGYPTDDPKILDGVLTQEFQGGIINGKEVIFNNSTRYQEFRKILLNPNKVIKFN
ncbi:hypothetical protein EZJ43_11500 [Pedobacter changchengzhani]|uniref:Uncharacterized protein n=1 Tax=Pedobacter changchengzhani TaxID=2529274 RepID=A0A4R5MKM2_9SPHI|nr:hypothetical protein [Pedobacter changchengzhani]TDG35966.1 hypothetical protein EZJ43_11500 [Pedobacter changchengzhani]